MDRARREGGARALHGVRQGHRRDPQRDRHARRLRLVGPARRLAHARSRGHRIEPGSARRDHRRGPRPPGHPAPRRHPLGARGRVVQLRDERPRHRARAALDGREHVRPGRQRDGLRPSDRLVQALRRRPRLRHRARPLRRALRRGAAAAASRRRHPVRRRRRGGRLRRHRRRELREGHARRQHERAVRARRRAGRPRLLHRARARPDPRLGPAEPERQDRAHARRLLGRRGRAARHHARPRFRRQRLALRLLRARQGRTTPIRRASSAA